MLFAMSERRIVRLVVLDTYAKFKAHSTYSLSKEQLEYCCVPFVCLTFNDRC